MYDLGISYTFNFGKKKHGIIRNIFSECVLILNGKENKEAGAICFELRIPRKKSKEIFWKVPLVYGINLIMEKTKTFFGLSIFPNIIT